MNGKISSTKNIFKFNCPKFKSQTTEMVKKSVFQLRNILLVIVIALHKLKWPIFLILVIYIFIYFLVFFSYSLLNNLKNKTNKTNKKNTPKKIDDFKLEILAYDTLIRSFIHIFIHTYFVFINYRGKKLEIIKYNLE